MENEKDVLSDEEISEQEKIANEEGDTLRAKVVEELGLSDDEDNEELINKIVERESGLRQGYGKLLGKYKAVKSKPSTPKGEAPSQGVNPDDIRKQTEALVMERLDNEYLEDLDYSDEIKDAIKAEAKRLGVSAKKAEKSEFIQFKINKEAEAQRANEAANDGSRKGIRVTDPSKPIVSDPTAPITEFDLSTEEGRNEYEEAKRARRK